MSLMNTAGNPPTWVVLNGTALALRTPRTRSAMTGSGGGPAATGTGERTGPQRSRSFVPSTVVTRVPPGS